VIVSVGEKESDSCSYFYSCSRSGLSCGLVRFVYDAAEVVECDSHCGCDCDCGYDYGCGWEIGDDGVTMEVEYVKERACGMESENGGDADWVEREFDCDWEYGYGWLSDGGDDGDEDCRWNCGSDCDCGYVSSFYCFLVSDGLIVHFPCVSFSDIVPQWAAWVAWVRC